MPRSNKLLAWVQPRGEEEFLASFVGGAATKRRPATHLYDSRDEARQWIEEEAAKLDLPIEWLSAAPEH